MSPSTILSLALFLFLAGIAGAVQCTSSLTGTITDNVNVPAGATCTLDGVDISGNVNVNSNAELFTTGSNTIGGFLRGRGYMEISVFDTVVTGNVILRNGQGDARFCDSQIGGDVRANGGEGLLIFGLLFACPASSISGNLLVRGGTGNIRITGSTVTGSFKALTRDGKAIIRDALISGPLTLRGLLGDNHNLSNSTFQSTVLVKACKAVNVKLSVLQNIRLIQNTGPIDFMDSTVNTAVLRANTGGANIATNTIATLNCINNAPSPVDSGGNTVANALGQCNGF